MARSHAQIYERFRGQSSAKIRDLAEKSARGSISGFQGIFQVAPAEPKILDQLAHSLADFCPKESAGFKEDVEQLTQLMQEVKALSHQALLLHGQRIQRAQEILKPYREGAFSAWLVMAYGNRQTPYNLLQYSEFYQSLPAKSQPIVEGFPRQVVYQLASRREPLDKKLAVIDLLSRHKRADYLQILRREMPVSSGDARQGLHPACAHLERAQRALRDNLWPLSPKNRARARQLVDNLARLLAD